MALSCPWPAATMAQLKHPLRHTCCCSPCTTSCPCPSPAAARAATPWNVATPPNHAWACSSQLQQRRATCMAAQPAASSTARPHQAPFGPKSNHPASFDEDPPFSTPWKHLNQQPLNLQGPITGDAGHPSRIGKHGLGSRTRLSPAMASWLFPLAAARQAAAVTAGNTQKTVPPAAEAETGASGSGDAATAAAAAAPTTPTSATSAAPPSVTPASLAAATEFEGQAQTSYRLEAAPRGSEARGPPLGSGARVQLLHRICASVAQQGGLDVKECLEAAEFYERTRRRMRSAVLVDLACGHGLAGLLYAALEPSVTHVLLMDCRRPASFDVLMSALVSQAPWVQHKVTYLEVDLGAVHERLKAAIAGSSSGGSSADSATAAAQMLVQAAGGHQGLSAGGSSGAECGNNSAAGDNGQIDNSSNGSSGPGSSSGSSGGSGSSSGGSGGGRTSRSGCSFIALHACGSLTDTVLDMAVQLRGPMAVMPCCYSGTAKGSPFGVRRALGVGMAADVDRSYRLAAAGYHVDWAAIPQVVTPMNRIIIGEP